VRPAYGAEAIRRAEQPLLDMLPAGALMQRAATGLSRRCAALLGRVYGSNVVLLVGAGNNGGDALWAGALLSRRGARVTALLAADAVHGDGLAALRAAGGRAQRAGGDGDADMFEMAELVVDGLIGIGGSGPLRAPHAQLAAHANECGALVVAVDVPSGVDATTGAVDGTAVRADVTVTFGAMKTGLVVAPGAEYAGIVDVVDIGLAPGDTDVYVVDAADVASALPVVGVETDKYRRGVLGVVAGSETYTGAAVLAVGGALATGVGMVRYVGPRGAADLVRARWPEAVVTVADGDPGAAIERAGRVQAWAVGSGLGAEGADDAVRAVLATDLPVLVDADGIEVVRRQPDLLRSRSAPTVLTPHAGEFARFTGADRTDVEAHRLDRLRAAAAELGAVILLKGSTTLVCDGTGAVRVNTASTPYLGTAGSGDVLSGVVAALLAGGADVLDAAAAGAYLHGLAGLLAVDVPAAAITAMDVVEALPDAVRAIRG
jgi:ADP-dependent NAD(P)H-hydrate dehydratase / NAD(P)H-hydrate epimerase